MKASDKNIGNAPWSDRKGWGVSVCVRGVIRKGGATIKRKGCEQTEGRKAPENKTTLVLGRSEGVDIIKRKEEHVTGGGRGSWYFPSTSPPAPASC